MHSKAKALTVRSKKGAKENPALKEKREMLAGKKKESAGTESVRFEVILWAMRNPRSTPFLICVVVVRRICCPSAKDAEKTALLEGEGGTRKGETFSIYPSCFFFPAKTDGGSHATPPGLPQGDQVLVPTPETRPAAAAARARELSKWKIRKFD